MGRPLRDTIQGVDQARNALLLIDGVIETGASAANDRVWVLFEKFDEGVYKHGPVIWTPQITELGLYYPKVNQPCIVARADVTGALWLLEWETKGEPHKTWKELTE